jgi:hypothetical protein
MGQRIYSAAFDNVTIAAVQDVFYLKAGAANGIEIHHIQLGAGAVTAAAEIRLRLKRLPATVTAGSGGSAPTISTMTAVIPKRPRPRLGLTIRPKPRQRHGCNYTAMAVECPWHVRVSACP